MKGFGLALSRRVGQSIVVGPNVIVTVTAIKGDKVTITLKAPPEVKILRHEVFAETYGKDAWDAIRPRTKIMDCPTCGEGIYDGDTYWVHPEDQEVFHDTEACRPKGKAVRS